MTAGTTYAIWIDPWDDEYVITDDNGDSSAIWCVVDGYFENEEEVLMPYTVIFSDNCDLRGFHLGGNIDICREDKITNEDTCYSVVRIMGMSRGLKFHSERPSKVIIEEPEVIQPKYYDWLLRVVIPTGSRMCQYVYCGRINMYVFNNTKEFTQYIEHRRRSNADIKF